MVSGGDPIAILLVDELDRLRITFEPVAVHEDLDAGLRLAVPADAAGIELNAHSVKNSPNVFSRDSVDSVWRTPV